MTTRIDSLSRPMPDLAPVTPPPSRARERVRADESAPLERTASDPALLRFVRDARASERSARIAEPSGVTRSEAQIDAERTARIRSFFAGYTVHVQGPDGPIDAPTPFDMNHSPKEVERKAAGLRKALGGHAADIAIGLLCAGRASPADMQKVATRLAALHPEQARDAKTFAEYLRRLEIGVDCAGSVQQALYASRGWKVPFDRGAFGLKPRLDEALGHLGARGFRTIADPADARPGDIVALGVPENDFWGHRVIVVEKHVSTASADDAERFVKAGCDVVRGDRIVELRVASSWGGRGPEEHSFFYDERTGTWSDDVHGLHESDDSGPYDHPLEGIFRAP